MRNPIQPVALLLVLHLASILGAKAQTLSLPIDSVVMDYIPMNISTILALDEVDMMQFDPEYRSRACIADRERMAGFLQVYDHATDTLSGSSVDVRMVIRPYAKGKAVQTIALGKSGHFMSGGRVVRNAALQDWIDAQQLPNLVMRTLPERYAEAWERRDTAVRVRRGYILPASKELVIIGDPSWERWKPTKEDVEVVEALLRPRLKAMRKSMGIRAPGRYRRQYVGYIGDQGERIVWVNAVCRAHRGGRPDLEPIIVFEGGPCYWNARVNIQERIVFDLGTNSSF